MLGSNNIGDHVLSLKFEQKQQKICILTQFSDNSPENLQRIKMLSSIKLEITDISTNFETQAAKSSSFHKYSADSHENFKIMLSSLNVEIPVYL